LLLFLNVACLAEKQKISIIQSLVYPCVRSVETSHART